MSGVVGKKAIVLCGSSGIGFGIASELKRAGAQVGITGRSMDRLKDAQQKSGIEQVLSVDHGVTLKTGEAVLQLTESLKGLDILVIHSAAPSKGLIEATTLDQWKDSFQKITLASVEAVQAGLPFLKKSQSGRIIFILSTAAREPIPNLLISTTLRSGMLGLMKSLSHDLAPFQITVNAVLPGYTRTSDAVIAASQNLQSQIPLGRLAEASEHGKLVSFLASNEASYITGQTISADGGLNRAI